MIHSRRRHGVSLLEMLIVVALFAASADEGQRLIFNVFRVNGQNSQMQDNASRSEDALRQMKADIWTAGQFQLIDSHHLEIKLPSNQTVSWQIDSAGNVERAAGTPAVADKRQWREIGKTWQFEANPCGIELTDTQEQAPRGQVLLLNEKRWADAALAGGKQ